jgi:hypothetical protein
VGAERVEIGDGAAPSPPAGERVAQLEAGDDVVERVDPSGEWLTIATREEGFARRRQGSRAQTLGREQGVERHAPGLEEAHELGARQDVGWVDPQAKARGDGAALDGREETEARHLGVQAQRGEAIGDRTARVAAATEKGDVSAPQPPRRAVEAVAHAHARLFHAPPRLVRA